VIAGFQSRPEGGNDGSGHHFSARGGRSLASAMLCACTCVIGSPFRQNSTAAHGRSGRIYFLTRAVLRVYQREARGARQGKEKRARRRDLIVMDLDLIMEVAGFQGPAFDARIAAHREEGTDPSRIAAAVLVHEGVDIHAVLKEGRPRPADEPYLTGNSGLPHSPQSFFSSTSSTALVSLMGKWGAPFTSR
jgi:hypothetical protein